MKTSDGGRRRSLIIYYYLLLVRLANFERICSYDEDGGKCVCVVYPAFVSL